MLPLDLEFRADNLPASSPYSQDPIRSRIERICSAQTGIEALVFPLPTSGARRPGHDIRFLTRSETDPSELAWSVLPNTTRMELSYALVEVLTANWKDWDKSPILSDMGRILDTSRGPMTRLILAPTAFVALRDGWDFALLQDEALEDDEAQRDHMQAMLDSCHFAQVMPLPDFSNHTRLGLEVDLKRLYRSLASLYFPGNYTPIFPKLLT